MGPNTEGIYREFPFLEKYFSKESVKAARVERIDEKLAMRVPETGFAGDLFIGPCYKVVVERILLLDKNGECMGRVGKEKITFPPRKMFFLISLPGHTETRDLPGETVWQAARRVGKAVHYVVAFSGETLVLYKPPKGFPSFLEWMEEQVRREQEAVREKVAAIDSL